MNDRINHKLSLKVVVSPQKIKQLPLGTSPINQEKPAERSESCGCDSTSISTRLESFTSKQEQINALKISASSGTWQPASPLYPYTTWRYISHYNGVVQNCIDHYIDSFSRRFIVDNCTTIMYS